MLLTANWTLSKDGKTLIDDYTEIGPDASGSNVKSVYQRTAGTSGFAGTWESRYVTVSFAFVLKVEPYEGDDLSIIDSTARLRDCRREVPTLSDQDLAIRLQRYGGRS